MPKQSKRCGCAENRKINAKNVYFVNQNSDCWRFTLCPLTSYLCDIIDVGLADLVDVSWEKWKFDSTKTDLCTISNDIIIICNLYVCFIWTIFLFLLVSFFSLFLQRWYRMLFNRKLQLIKYEYHGDNLNRLEFY